MPITGPQIRAARSMLGKTQKEAAAAAGVSEPTIKRLEGQDGELTGHTATIAAIRRHYEEAGIVFLDDGKNEDGGPGIRLRGQS